FVHQPGAHAGGRGLGERRRQQAAGDSGTPFSASTYPLLALLIAVIGFVGLCNNVLVLGLYLKFKRLRTPANLFLVNISLSDLLVSFFGLSFTFLSCLRNGWARDEAGCVWDGFSNSLFGIVSLMTLTVLAYERYIRVVHARVIDFSWSWRAITYIWLYSLAWTGAPLLGWNHYTLELHGLGCSVDWSSREPSDTSFVLFFFFGCLVVPLGIVVFCYGHILHALAPRLFQYETKVAKMCFLMITTFLICWMPYAVVSLLIAYGYGHLITPTVAIIPSFFAKSNIAYNPIIFFFMNRKFRQCLMQLVCVHLLWFQRILKGKPAIRSEKPVRPTVGSQKVRDRPKKKVTFSSSSVIFIITNDEMQQIDDSLKDTGTKANVIQVKPF
uniref:Opsin-3 n=1 Tax=Laticauda laticaudata TaxID=8630 RepID=A0A8C5RMN1_LATLA